MNEAYSGSCERNDSSINVCTTQKPQPTLMTSRLINEKQLNAKLNEVKEIAV